MPLPKPTENEEQDDFISRCVPLAIADQELDAEDEEERNQAVAICHSQWRAAQEEDKSMENKAEEQALEDQLSTIRQAFDQAFNREPEEIAQPVGGYAWIEKTHDDYVIAERGNLFFKVPLSIDDEGKITFGEPEEV